MSGFAIGDLVQMIEPTGTDAYLKTPEGNLSKCFWADNLNGKHVGHIGRIKAFKGQCHTANGGMGPSPDHLAVDCTQCLYSNTCWDASWLRKVPEVCSNTQTLTSPDIESLKNIVGRQEDKIQRLQGQIDNMSAQIRGLLSDIRGYQSKLDVHTDNIKNLYEVNIDHLQKLHATVRRVEDRSNVPWRDTFKTMLQGARDYVNENPLAIAFVPIVLTVAMSYCLSSLGSFLEARRGELELASIPAPPTPPDPSNPREKAWIALRAAAQKAKAQKVWY